MAFIEHSFWCWKNKLQGVLQLLCLVSDYSFSEIDEEIVRQGLYLTNADESHLFVYDISTSQGFCEVTMALNEDDRDIVFITVKAAPLFQERINFVERIQASLKTIDIDFA